MKLLSTKGMTILCTHHFKVLNEFDGRLSLVRRGGEITLEHPLEGPLRPLIIDGITGADLALPIEAEADLIQLRTITVDILKGGLLRMLTCLDGILLCRQTVGIVAHRVQYVETLQTLIAGIDV